MAFYLVSGNFGEIITKSKLLRFETLELAKQAFDSSQYRFGYVYEFDVEPFDGVRVTLKKSMRSEYDIKSGEWSDYGKESTNR